jgi:ATP-dependent RNA helicase DDX56/DBP9
VLSFVSIREKPLLDEVENYLKNGQEDISIFKAYKFKLDEVEAFKYRAKDAWRAVTRIAVREARLKEIKQEIFNCQKLKNYFEDNPTDLQVLRHDKALHTVKIQQHLSDVPEYIVPPTLKGMTGLSKKNKRKRDSYQTSQASSKRFQVSLIFF